MYEAKTQHHFFLPYDNQTENLSTSFSLKPTRASTDSTSVSNSAQETAPFDENTEISSPSSPVQEDKSAGLSAGSPGVKSTSPASLEDDAISQQNNFEDLINIEDEEEREMLLSKGWRASDDQTLLGLASKYKCDWKKISKKFDNKKFTPYFLKIRYKELIDAPVQKKHKFTEAEDLLLAKLYKTIGSEWNEMSKQFKNRTGVMLKNRYYSYIRKRGLLDDLVAKAESQPIQEAKPATSGFLAKVEVPKTPETYLEKKQEVQLLDFSDFSFSQTCFEFEGLQNSDELHHTITPMEFDESLFATQNAYLSRLDNRTYVSSYNSGAYYAPQYNHYRY